MRISDWSSDVCSSDLHQNLPISKTIRTRTAFIYNRDDGFQKNRYTGTRFGKTKVWGIRETIDVDLSESITNSFIVNYSSTDNNPALSAFRGTRDPITGAPCAPERILANECVTAGGDRTTNRSKENQPELH